MPMNAAKLLLLNVLGGGSAPFSPLDIPGLVLWLDASDSATLFQDSAGTTPATADNDVVGYWADKSGNAHHVTQSTTASKPVLDLAAQNGRNVVSFGGSHFLSGGDILDLGTASLTLFVVGKITATSQSLVSKSDVGVVGRYAIIAYSANLPSVIYQNAGGTYQAQRLTALPGVTELFAAVVNRPSGSVELHIDGALIGSIASFTPDTGEVLNTALPLLVGAYGASGGEAYHLIGIIPEVVMFQRATALTADEMTAMSTYLSSKWGIS